MGKSLELRSRIMDLESTLKLRVEELSQVPLGSKCYWVVADDIQRIADNLLNLNGLILRLSEGQQSPHSK
jgi:hypothetical protein